MNITIKQDDGGIWALAEGSTDFECTHANAEVEKNGHTRDFTEATAYCPDCKQDVSGTFDWDRYFEDML